MMGTMRQTCTGRLPGGAGRRAFWLQVRVRRLGQPDPAASPTSCSSAGCVAFCGGRLKVSTPRPGRPRRGSRADDLARCCWSPGWSAAPSSTPPSCPSTWTEWAAAGTFFVLLTAAELAVAGLLLARRARPRGAARRGRGLGRPAPAVAVVPHHRPAVRPRAGRTRGGRAGRRRGLPAGGGHAGPRGRPPPRVGPGPRRRAPSATHVPRLALVALVAVTAVGLAGTQLSWFDVLVGAMEH